VVSSETPAASSTKRTMITKASTIIGPRSNRRYCGRACSVSRMGDMRGLLGGRLARKASKELRDRPLFRARG
jgi:hypothetical protein